MNIALWLERTGKTHPDRPAAALGERVLLDYGALAKRTARLAGALRTRCMLDCGDRVAIVAKNCVAYLEALYGIWHAGLAGVLVNAKLHGAEIGYSSNIPVRVHASPRRDLTRTSRRLHRSRSNTLSLSAAQVTSGCLQRMRSPLSRAHRTTWPGCSTRRGRPAALRARCSPIACYRS